jgi:hypothetical protein
VIAELEYAVFEGASLAALKRNYCGVVDKAESSIRPGAGREEVMQAGDSIRALQRAAVAPYLNRASLEFHWTNGKCAGTPDTERVLSSMK